MVALIINIQCGRSNTSSKQWFSVDVKLDDDARVTVWDEEALSHANCELIKGRLLGRRGDIVAPQRQHFKITLTSIASRKEIGYFGRGRS